MKKSIRIFIAFLTLLVGLVFALTGMADPRKGGDENATEKLGTGAQYGALQAAEVALRGEPLVPLKKLEGYSGVISVHQLTPGSSAKELIDGKGSFLIYATHHSFNGRPELVGLCTKRSVGLSPGGYSRVIAHLRSW